MANYKIIDAKIEKGNIYCLTDTDKIIRIDFNNNITYGISGRPVKTCPAFERYIKSSNRYLPALLNILMCNYYQWSHTNLPYHIMRYADKLLNMGYDWRYANAIINHYKGWFDENTPLNNNSTYATIAKIVKMFPEEENFEKAIYDYTLYQIRKEFETNEIYHLLTEKQKDFVSRTCYENSIIRKYASYLIYWVAFEEYECYHTRIFNYSYNLFSSLADYFMACEKLEIKPEKKNIYKHFSTTYRAYRDYENKKLDIVITQNQMLNKEKFFYEDDNYTMIFPMTSAEFIKEGDTLNNCLGWNNYNTRVANNECIITFIREKANPTKSYIACDIRFDIYDKPYIHQFLTYNNSTPNFNNNINLETYYRNFTKFIKSI